MLLFARGKALRDNAFSEKKSLHLCPVTRTLSSMRPFPLIPLFTSWLILLAACHSGPTFSVQGRITGAADSVLHFEANAIGGVEEIATTRLTAEGDFQFEAPSPECPEFYVLRIGERRIHLCVDSTEHVTVQANYADMGTNYTVKGSQASEHMRHIIADQQEVQRQLVTIERRNDLLPGPLVDSLRSVLDAYKGRMKEQYIFADPWSGAAYFALCQSLTDLGGTFYLFNPLDDRADVQCYAAVATAWDGRWPDAPRTEQLCNMAIRGMKNTQPVRRNTVEIDENLIAETGIIDVELPDINGELQRLSDLRGQVVLLDFTLYSAERSAQRTRLMRDLYDRYHPRGLAIYQVSLDDDTHFWQFACENLPWICVHETDGTATGLYAVSDLPTFFLINRSLEVVKRSSQVTDLATEIEALL